MTAHTLPLHAGAHALDHAHDDHGHHELSFVKKYIFSCDHKVIGIQFLFMGLMFFVFGGLLALVVRWQLGFPNNPTAGIIGKPVPVLATYLKWPGGEMPQDFYNGAFTMHATIMIFFVIIPLLVGTFGNYLIPLKIGAGDMAFPFMNGLAFWTALPAGAIMVASFFLPGGPAFAGWTSYPTLSELQLNDGKIGYLAPSGLFENLAMFLRTKDPTAISDKYPQGIMGTWPAIALFMN